MPGRSLGELARLVGGDLEGDPSLEIRGFASLESAGPGDLSFVVAARHLDAARRSAAAALIAPPGLDLGGRPAIRVAQPYAAIAAVLPVFFPEPAVAPGVHPTAHVADSARVSADRHRGRLRGRRGALGRRGAARSCTRTSSWAPTAEVGEGSVLHPHVVLRARVPSGAG